MNETNGQPVELSLEDQITLEIETIAGSVLAQTQQGEVARSFLCLARSYAKEGCIEHAEKKRKAALAVLTGVVNDD